MREENSIIMGKKKGFTLLEIIVSVACMSLLVIVMYQIINSTVMYTVSGVSNVKAQDEIKQITETMRINVANATEMYILDKEPTTKDNTYQYFYSRDGVIYYYNSEEIAIDSSDSIENRIEFKTDVGSKILKYTVYAKQRNLDKSSNSSIYIGGLTDVINKPKNMGGVNVGNCIMFRVNSDTAVITNFVLNNDSQNPLLVIPVQGIIQDGTIDLYVPKMPENASKVYTPNVTFIGDRVVVSRTKIENLDNVLNISQESEGLARVQANGYELQKVPVDFSNPVYYYVIANENVREYKVRLIESKEIEIDQDNSLVGDQKIIRYDKDFYVTGIKGYGTIKWYTEGRTEPVYEVVIDETTVSTDKYKLSPKKLYEDANDNMLGAEKENYNYKNQGEYEDVMRYITVKFEPADGGDAVYAEPKLIYPISENASNQSIEEDFYFKVATDIWIESKKRDRFSDSWLSEKTGARAVEEFKGMYKAATGGDDYKVVAKLNTKNEGYDKAPEFVRVMYHVNTKNSLNYNNYVVEPKILVVGEHAVDNTISDGYTEKDKSTSYSRTAFSVDLEEYLKINEVLVDTLNRYEVSATYSKSAFKNVTIPNVAETLPIEKGNNISTSIGIFNSKNNDGDIKGFRAVAGTEKGKGYLKSVNYEDVAIESTAVKIPNVMQEYRYAINDINNLESVTVRLKAFRQSNVDKSILYYSNVDVDGTRIVDAYLETDKNYMKEGNPTLIGEGKYEHIENMLVGDNFYAGDKIDMMNNENPTTDSFASTTIGNVLSFGMSSNSVGDASDKNYAQYITNISFDAGSDYTLKLMDAKVVGHTAIDDMKDSSGNIQKATIVRLRFDKDVRSGYSNNSIDEANVDSTIVDTITNKHINKATLNNGMCTTITDEYTQNLVADKISFEGGGETFKVLMVEEDKKQYAYKTANADDNNEFDTITVLIDGVLKKNQEYTIKLETGSIRAVHGGDLEIKVGDNTITGIEEKIDDAAADIYGDEVFNIGTDIFNTPDNAKDKEQLVKYDGNLATDKNGSNTIDNNLVINYDKNTIGGGGSAYYIPVMYRYKLNNEGVNAEKGFLMETTIMRKKPWSWEPRYDSHAIMGKNSLGADEGYVMYVTDVFNWTADYNGNIKDQVNFENEKISAVYMLSTMNGQIVGTDGTILSGDYRGSEKHSINGYDGRLYFKRNENEWYTFSATIKGDTVTLQVSDSKGVVPTYVRKVSENQGKYISKDTEILQDGYTFNIPSKQLHTGIKYNEVGIRNGSQSAWENLDAMTFYDENNGFVIKKIE